MNIFKKKLLKKIEENMDFDEAIFIYDFTENKIEAQNQSLVKLYGFENEEEFVSFSHDKLFNLVGTKVTDKVRDNYSKKVTKFNLHFSFFTKDNQKKYGTLVANINFEDNLMFCFVLDVTDQIQLKNEMENSFLLDTAAKRLELRALVANFDSVVKIDVDTFKATSISIDGEDIKEQALSVDWNEYYKFILSLVSKDDLPRLENFATKEAIQKLVRDGVTFKSEKFKSAFTLQTASKLDKETEYELIVEVLTESDKKQVFLLIEPLEPDNNSQGGFNLINSFTSDYTSILSINQKTNTITLRKTTESHMAGFLKYKDGLPIDSAFTQYANSFVYEEDRDLFLKSLLNGAIFKNLEGRQSYILKFRRDVNGVISNMMFYFVRAINADSEENIYLAVRCADNDQNTEFMLNVDIDSLSEVYNYKGFIGAVDKRLEDNGYKGFIVRFDIDNFTRYNTLFGIEAGDKAFAKIGNILQSLERDYEMISGRFSSDTFLIYINCARNTLDKFIEQLKYRMSRMSQYFDFVLTVGVYHISDSEVSVHDMIDCAILAAETIKERHNKTYAMYTPSIRKDASDRIKRLTRVVQALKEDEVTAYFRPVYQAERVIAYDFNIELSKRFDISSYNVYDFLEKNGLSVKINKKYNETILDVCKKEKKSAFILPITKHLFVRHGEMEELIKFINLNEIDKSRIVFSIQPDVIDDDPSALSIIKRIRNENIDIIFDYTTSTKFDFKALYQAGINWIKLDAFNFRGMGEYGMRVLHQVASSMLDAGFKVYIAHLFKEEMSQFTDLEELRYSYGTGETPTVDEFLKNLSPIKKNK